MVEEAKIDMIFKFAKKRDCRIKSIEKSKTIIAVSLKISVRFFVGFRYAFFIASFMPLPSPLYSLPLMLFSLFLLSPLYALFLT